MATRRSQPARRNQPATVRHSQQAPIAAVDPSTKMAEIGALVNTHRRGLESFLKGLLTPERMAGLVFQAIRKTPALGECTSESIISCMYEASILELKPNTYAQECFLIPRDRSFKQGGQWTKIKEATFQVGYQGARKLALRAETRVPVFRVRAEHVYEMDAFERTAGSTPAIEHIPHNGVDKGTWLGTYAVADYVPTKEGHTLPPSVEWLDAGMMARVEAFALDAFDIGGMTDTEVFAELERYRAKCISEWKGKDDWKLSKPWWKWREQMQRKTAIKRMCKQLPLPDEAQRAMHLDDLAESLKSQQNAFAISQILQDSPSPGAQVQVPAQGQLAEPPPDDAPLQDDGPPPPEAPDVAGPDVDEEIADLAERIKEEGSDKDAKAVDSIITKAPSPGEAVKQLRKMWERLNG